MSAQNTAVAIPLDIPAHIRVLQEQAAAQNKSAMGGIKAGGFPRISIGGSKFSIVENGEKTLLTSGDGEGLPVMQLELAVIGYNPGISKKFYEGKYADGDDKEPGCSSDDGISPDPHIQQPQSTTCASCPKNVWGSKISEQGKQIKACSDSKRLAVLIMSDDLENEQAFDLTITPAALKEWANYVRALDAKGIPVDGVVTKVQFDPAANYPKLIFKFGRFLTAEEVTIVARRSQGDDVRLIVSPRKSTSSGPVIPIQPAAAPVPPAPAAPKVTVPVAVPPAPKPVDPYEGLPPHVKAAVEASGGLTSEPGKLIYKTLTGKDAPSTAAPAPAAPPPAPKPVDPYEGLPAHVKPSVEAAGGLGTPAGSSVYKALTGKDVPAGTGAPVPAAEPAAAPAGRRRRTTTAPTPPAAPTTAAPTVAVPPPLPVEQPKSGFAAAAGGGTGGLTHDLDALLANAMSTPASK